MPRIGSVIRDVYRRPGEEDLPGHLERQYGIEVTGVTKLAAGVLRVDRRDGLPWVARMHLIARPAERARRDAQVLRFVERQRCAAERCVVSDPVSELGGRAVLVTEFVAGRPWPASPAADCELGDYVGRLHALRTDGPEPEDAAARRRAGSLHHLPDYEGGPEQDLAAAAAMLTDVEDRVPAEHAATHAALRALLPRGDDCRGLPETFVHPDAARVNVLTAGGGPVLMDWTGAGTGPRLASLAVLLHSAGPGGAAEVLRGYGRHQQLTAEELDRLEGVLWIRPLWLAAWRCWLACVSGRVNRAQVPDAADISALAAAVRTAVRPG